MNRDLRTRRNQRSVEELEGRRGDPGDRAIRWSELENHPLIRVLTQGAGISEEVQAELDDIITSVGNAQSTADTAAGAAAGAQATADGAAAVAATALANAATAQSTADTALSDAGTALATFANYYTSVQIDTSLAAYYDIAQIDGILANYDDAAAAQVKLDALKTAIENPAGTSLGATLATGYYTIADTDQAISAATTALQSTLEGEIAAGDAAAEAAAVATITATLTTGYYTIAQADSAISAATTSLGASLEGQLAAGDAATLAAVTATLETEHYTITETDAAIAAANTSLQATLEGQIAAGDAASEAAAVASVQATLDLSYYTAAEADQAISSATTSLQSTLEGQISAGDAATIATLTATLTASYYTIAGADAAIAAGIASYDAGAANVTSIQQAMTDLQGFSAAHAGLTATIDGSGFVSGIKATTWANPDGAAGSTLELLGSVIAQGTIATNRLTVGLGLNWLSNTQYFAPLAPSWSMHEANGAAGAATTIAKNPPGDPYAWPSFPTLSLYQNDGATTGYFDLAHRPPMDAAGTLAPGYAVSEGERVSFSCRMSAHRCTGQILLAWYDGAGTFLSVTDSTNAVAGVFSTASPGPAGSVSNPDLWPQLWMLADVPLGVQAAYVRPVFRKGPSGSGDANSELFIARAMLAETHPAATTFTPYSPDQTTLIDGDQILTGSITADKITVSSISVISPNLGTFQSAMSGERMEISDNGIKVYDSNGTLRVQIGDLS